MIVCSMCGMQHHSEDAAYNVVQIHDNSFVCRDHVPVGEYDAKVVVDDDGTFRLRLNMEFEPQ